MTGELQSESSAQPPAAADRNFSAFWLTSKQQHTMASSMISHSMINADYNGAVFMIG